MKIFQSKKCISLMIVIAIIVLLLVLLFMQNNKHKTTIGGYDIMSLSQLENELELLVYLAEKNELTQELYSQQRERIKIINSFIGRSPNIRSMNYSIYSLIDYNDKDEFIKESLEQCKSFQLELEGLLRELDNGINTYNYFVNKENRIELLKHLK